MTRTWMLGGLACLLCAAVVFARPGRVTTKQGKTFEGDVTERGQSVEVRMADGKTVRLNKANVEVAYDASIEDQFNERMSKLKDNDSAGRLELARWAFDQGEYSLALDALDAAIDIDPNNEEARAYRRNVQKHQEMLRRSGKGKAKGNGGNSDAADDAGAADGGEEEAMADDEGGNAGGGDDGGADDTGAEEGNRRGNARGNDGDGGRGNRRQAVKTRLVTPQEINRIRQLEWQKGDKAQVRFENDVRRRYLASSEFTPQQFNKLTPAEQVSEILSNGSSRLHRDVIINSDPFALQQFKNVVQRAVLPGCATAACHGGNKAGNFVLHNPANKDPEAYTNFLLLQQYTGGGDAGAKDQQGRVGGQRKDRDRDAGDGDEEEGRGGRTYAMVDRTRPEDSLLLLYGLADSNVPHPKAQNFRPIFKGRNDPRYRQIVEWMGQTLAPIAPDYGIDLTKDPEDGDSTTRPARGNRGGGGGGGGNRRQPARDDDDGGGGGGGDGADE